MVLLLHLIYRDCLATLSYFWNSTQMHEKGMNDWFWFGSEAMSLEDELKE